mgnify:CR=1 FL=1
MTGNVVQLTGEIILTLNDQIVFRPFSAAKG